MQIQVPRDFILKRCSSIITNIDKHVRDKVDQGVIVKGNAYTEDKHRAHKMIDRLSTFASSCNTPILLDDDDLSFLETWTDWEKK